jgi:non-ribosomal peptide synthetase component E (peptide arylation enzyme)
VAVVQLTPERIDRYRRAGIWQDQALYRVVDEIAGRTPDVIAVADQHEQLSYAELVRRSANLAAWLLAQGLTPGAPVAVQCGNRTALAVSHLACDRADLLFIPLSSAWRGTEMAHLLGVSRAEVLVASAPLKGFDYLATVAELRSSLPHLRAVGGMDGSGGEFDFDAICREDRPFAAPPRDPDAPRFVMVTSGTTGLPHMSLWSDNNLWYFMTTFIAATQLTAGDVAVGIAPASTGATGYVFPVLAPLLCGATSVLLEEWTAENALDLLESMKATHATAIPTQVLKLFNDPSIGGRDFSSLRTFTNAGAAMPPEAGREMERVFGCIEHVCYGATDGGSVAMLRYDDPPEKRYTTVGRVFEFNEVRLVDAAMNDAAPGAVGEIVWRTPTKSFGYLNEPERTEAAFSEDGWYRSGDLGTLDDENYLSVVGRVKDLVIRGGQNISPRELEDLIIASPEVADVAVIGIPDELFGERVCACLVLRPGAKLPDAELLARLRRHNVATFKLPERIEIFEDFPKSAGGKVSKLELRAMVAKRHSTAVDA